MQTLIKTLATARVKPFVSVVTPARNRGAFLPYLLYMYRYQDYPADRRELIILDDSPQSHQHIIDHLTKGTPGSFNIRYIHHPEKLPLGKNAICSTNWRAANTSSAWTMTTTTRQIKSLTPSP